ISSCLGLGSFGRSGRGSRFLSRESRSSYPLCLYFRSMKTSEGLLGEAPVILPIANAHSRGDGQTQITWHCCSGMRLPSQLATDRLPRSEAQDSSRSFGTRPETISGQGLPADTETRRSAHNL